MKNYSHFLIILFFIGAMCLSCTGNKNEAAEMNKLMSTISANDNAWNILDVEKIVGMFAEDGMLLNDNSEILKGKDASVSTLRMKPRFHRLSR